MPTATSPGLDGRTARKLANRERILDAALELAARGEDVEVETIAASAGVSVRSVYNHFATARDLIAGMYERGSERVRPMIEKLPSPAEPFDTRVGRFVNAWARVQEEIAPIRWRALIAEDRHPELQPELAELRRAHRAEMKRMFPEVTGRQAQAALTAITDSLAWRSLRKHQGLGFEAACEVVEAAIRRLAR